MEVFILDRDGTLTKGRVFTDPHKAICAYGRALHASWGANYPAFRDALENAVNAEFGTGDEAKIALEVILEAHLSITN